MKYWLVLCVFLICGCASDRALPITEPVEDDIADAGADLPGDDDVSQDAGSDLSIMPEDMGSLDAAPEIIEDLSEEVVEDTMEEEDMSPPVDLPPEPTPWTQQRVTEGLLTVHSFQGEDPLAFEAVDGLPGQQPLEVLEGELVPLQGRNGISILRAARMVQTDTADFAAEIRESQAFTVEVWARPYSLENSGPARLMALEDTATDRNLTLGQTGTSLAVRVRTGANPAAPTTLIPDIFTDDEVHLIITYQDGDLTIFANGLSVFTEVLTGEGGEAPTLAWWDESFSLNFGNLPYGEQRAWTGEIYMAALYKRALSPQEVLQNHNSGPGPGYTYPNQTLSVASITQRIEETDATQVAWTLTRLGDVSQALDVDLRIRGRALHGQDFTVGVEESLVMLPAQNQAAINLTANVDSAVEGCETVSLQLLSTAQYKLVGPSRAWINVCDPLSSARPSVWLQGEALHCRNNEATRSWSDNLDPTLVAPVTDSARCVMGSVGFALLSRWDSTIELSPLLAQHEPMQTLAFMVQPASSSSVGRVWTAHGPEETYSINLGTDGQWRLDIESDDAASSTPLGAFSTTDTLFRIEMQSLIGQLSLAIYLEESKVYETPPLRFTSDFRQEMSFGYESGYSGGGFFLYDVRTFDHVLTEDEIRSLSFRRP